MLGLVKRVKELTDGRGADTVIEGVGHADALRTAFDLLRPWGNISSFGRCLNFLTSLANV
jgi:threonine dehydrogenase-like Zn-dependent dehydrogenase